MQHGLTAIYWQSMTYYLTYSSFSYNEAAELCLLKYSVGWTLEYDEDFDSACLYGEGYYGYYMEGGDLEDCS